MGLCFGPSAGADNFGDLGRSSPVRAFKLQPATTLRVITCESTTMAPTSSARVSSSPLIALAWLALCLTGAWVVAVYVSWSGHSSVTLLGGGAFTIVLGAIGAQRALRGGDVSGLRLLGLPVRDFVFSGIFASVSALGLSQIGLV